MKRLVLIASRYDEGLQDTIYDFDSLEEADEDTKKSLRRVAMKNINAYMEMMRKKKRFSIVDECFKGMRYTHFCIIYGT